MAHKRKRDSKSELEAENKRLREFAEKTAEELMCAISHELPVDPVTAEDGHVYERGLITKWIKEVEAKKKPLKSPKLNTPMGPRLFPATQVRNTIREMVRSGAVSGPKANVWAKRIADEEEVKKTCALAEGGDGDAMYDMGDWYQQGMKGLAVDFKQAVGWWQRGYDIDNMRCTANLAFCYVQGIGVEKDDVYGMYLSSIAAHRGSALARFNLGLSFANGLLGMRKNVREAERWFRSMGSASVRDVTDSHHDEATNWLREHADSS